MPKLKSDKPGYSTSRRVLWFNNALAWATVVAIVWVALRGEAQAVALASFVVPSLLALIAALLGIHRFAGAMDLRAAADYGRTARTEPSRDGDDEGDGANDEPRGKRKGADDD